MRTDPIPKAEIASRLRTARVQAGLSQGQVAKLLGLHRPTISEVEAGRRSVSILEITKFAEIYAVDVGWLTGLSDPKEELLSAKTLLAARELERLKPEDLDRLLELLSSLRKGGP